MGRRYVLCPAERRRIEAQWRCRMQTDNTMTTTSGLHTYSLIQEVRQRQQPQGVACWSCVKDNMLEVSIVRALEKLHHFADSYCLVYSWRQSLQQLTCHRKNFVNRLVS